MAVYTENVHQDYMEQCEYKEAHLACQVKKMNEYVGQPLTVNKLTYL